MLLYSRPVSSSSGLSLRRSSKRIWKSSAAQPSRRRGCRDSKDPSRRPKAKSTPKRCSDSPHCSASWRLTTHHINLWSLLKRHRMSVIHMSGVMGMKFPDFITKYCRIRNASWWKLKNFWRSNWSRTTNSIGFDSTIRSSSTVWRAELCPMTSPRPARPKGTRQSVNTSDAAYTPRSSVFVRSSRCLSNVISMHADIIQVFCSITE